MSPKLILIFERTYIWIHKLKRSSLGWILSFIVAAASTLPYEMIFDIKGMMLYVFIKPPLPILLMWGCCVIALLLFVLDSLIVRTLQKYNDFSQLEQIMRENADNSCFNLEKYSNGFIWGQDRTILVCSNIIEGYRTHQIHLDSVITDKYYRFQDSPAQCSTDLNKSYEDFIRTDKTARISIEQNNDNDKWMLAGISKTCNRDDQRVYLKLQKTKWSMNRFIWCKVFPELLLDKKAALAEVADDYTKGYYPNSLCLHLVVITADRKVVLNKISGVNSNDYPYTLAATIGEQLEISDFNNRTDYNNEFVDRWIERAFKEEFGLTETNYHRIVDADSARVLAFVEEGDIYNFSMVTTVTLNYSFEDFKRHISVAPVMDKEFTDPVPLDIKDIPGELNRHFKNCRGKGNGDYHPATAMRLFLTYAHFYGICRFKNEYQSAHRRRNL